MKKTDYKKELTQFYGASAKKVKVVEVPQMNFLMIDGEGDPNTSKAFQNAVETLFGISYTLKFVHKKGKEAIDYGVMPLEGLWWADDMSQFQGFAMMMPEAKRAIDNLGNFIKINLENKK